MPHNQPPRESSSTRWCCRGATGYPRHAPAPDQLAGHDGAAQTIRRKLGEEAFAVAWAEGRALPLEKAIAALEELRESGVGAGLAE
jgi:hypothetical protein